MYRQSGATHIPLRVNAAGMIPLIFAFSILILPSTIASYFANPSSDSFVSNISLAIQNAFGPTSVVYWIAVFFLVVVFTFFYTLVVHNQQNLSENLQKKWGFYTGNKARPSDKRIFNESCFAYHVGWSFVFRYDRDHAMDSAAHYESSKCDFHNTEYKLIDNGWCCTRYHATA